MQAHRHDQSILTNLSIKYNIPVEELLRIKGMREASTYHTFWGDEQ